MSTQFNELPTDIQQLIFARAIVDAPRTGVKLSAVDREIGRLVREGNVWQPLANALGVDISQFNFSVHTREIIELHDFKPIADALQEAADAIYHARLRHNPAINRVEVPRTLEGARAWVHELTEEAIFRLLADLFTDSFQPESKIVLEICKLLLQTRSLDPVSLFTHLHPDVSKATWLDTATRGHIHFLLLQYFDFHSDYVNPESFSKDKEGGGTWETILKDPRKMDNLFGFVFSMIRHHHLPEEVAHKILTLLFQRGLTVSDSALGTIAARRYILSENKYLSLDLVEKVRDIERRATPSRKVFAIGAKLHALGRSLLYYLEDHLSRK